MSLKIVRDDLLKVKADAIVNPTDIDLSGRGSIDKRVHEACGPLLKEEIKSTNGIKVSEVLVTKSYNLETCKYIIHVAGPKYVDSKQNEFGLLRTSYRNILNAALEKDIKSVAIPLISTGTFSFPKREAFNIAREEINDFLDEHPLKVKLIVYDNESFSISKELSKEVEDYIDDNYVQTFASICFNSIDTCDSLIELEEPTAAFNEEVPHRNKRGICEPIRECKLSFELDESFSEALFAIIDEKGLKDPEVYKKAGIDRKLFSTIRSNHHYRPSKKTAVALCIALELNIEETNNLLEKAGMILSHSDLFDVIIEYFIKKKNYDLYDINSALLENDLPLIGC